MLIRIYTQLTLSADKPCNTNSAKHIVVQIF